MERRTWLSASISPEQLRRKKDRESRQTYHNRTTTRFSVHVLVAQVEDKCGSAVEKGKYSDTDVKLCRGRVVSSQIVNSGGCLIDFAVRNIVGILHQPAQTQNILIMAMLKVNTHFPVS